MLRKARLYHSANRKLVGKQSCHRAFARHFSVKISQSTQRQQHHGRLKLRRCRACRPLRSVQVIHSCLSVQFVVASVIAALARGGQGPGEPHEPHEFHPALQAPSSVMLAARCIGAADGALTQALRQLQLCAAACGATSAHPGPHRHGSPLLPLRQLSSSAPTQSGAPGGHVFDEHDVIVGGYSPGEQSAILLLPAAPALPLSPRAPRPP